MSQSTTHILDNPLDFPLNGSRLIEASAGTGKTYTIAALYVRLVIGHGTQDTAFERELVPKNILVMTFTKAATEELSDRIRARLAEAAAYFRDPDSVDSDPFLASLREGLRSERTELKTLSAITGFSVPVDGRSRGQNHSRLVSVDAKRARFCQRQFIQSGRRDR